MGAAAAPCLCCTTEGGTDGFEQSQTKKNLEAAFAGESQAHTKYRYYSSKAKKEGYVQISNIFMETALNEAEHAKLWFGRSCTAVAISRARWRTCATRRARTTSGLPCTTSSPRPPRKKGLTAIAAKFRGVGAVEKAHEERYNKLAERVEKGEVFAREGVKVWKRRTAATSRTSAPLRRSCAPDAPIRRPI